MEPNQLNLFPDVKPTPAHRAEALVMSADTLLKWKSQILDYQQKVRENKPPQQTALFDLTPKHCEPDQIDPLLLRLVPMSFYRMPVDSSGSAYLYFIIDSAASAVLYVGETCRSNKRWKGNLSWGYANANSTKKKPIKELYFEWEYRGVREKLICDKRCLSLLQRRH
ncbi:MAG: hypothetical protein HWQ44_13305 [Nostoc sp. JL34]|uniref:hypothetical protein n=1 Tax=Nostoc sp. JL34 TaxID=2815397 RepID=UPI001D742C6E|nr:hypothetical protein [Nostoc sp. JL34]MBN3883914.1 hypothetical protein [Nostoc sp. JL34]